MAISETKTLLLIYPQTTFNQSRNTCIFQLNIFPSSHWNCDGRLLCVNGSYHPGNPLGVPWWTEPATRCMWMSSTAITTVCSPCRLFNKLKGQMSEISTQRGDRCSEKMSVGSRIINTWTQNSCLVLVSSLLSCSLCFVPLQRIANLLPAWYYNFRVTMVTWGDPELSCCDSSTVSFITGNQLKTLWECSETLGKSDLGAVFYLQIAASYLY